MENQILSLTNLITTAVKKRDCYLHAAIYFAFHFLYQRTIRIHEKFRFFCVKCQKLAQRKNSAVFLLCRCVILTFNLTEPKGVIAHMD